MTQPSTVTARDVIAEAWRELGAEPQSTGDLHPLDGPYGQVLTLAEERTRSGQTRVSLQELYQAVMDLYREHSSGEVQVA